MLFRDRFFSTVTRATTHRPGLVLAVVGGVLLASSSLLPSLKISTSRYGLVAEDNAYQKRLFRFFEEFGYPDAPLLVVTGGTSEQQRHLVDQLVERLQQLDILEGRVLARIGPEEVAELILLQRPDLLTSLENDLAQGRSPAELISGGLPAVANAMQSQLHTFATTVQMQALTPFGATISHEQTEEILDGITSLARAAQSSLQGHDTWHEVISANSGAPIQWSGVDDKGYLAGEGGEYHLIALFPRLPTDEVTQLQPLVHRIRALRDDVEAKLNTEAHASLTGVPTFAVDEMAVLRKGVFQSSFATAAAILLLFLFAFRSIRQTILAGLPLLLGIVTSLAFAQLIYGELNLVTSSFVSVLLGLGIDFSVHTLARYNEVRREGSSPVDAIVGAITRSGPAIVTGAITTALAFLTTKTTDFTAFAELGVITAVGLILMLLATFFIIPAVISASPRFQSSTAPEIPGIHKLPKTVNRAPKTLLVLATLAGVVGAFAIPGLRFNSRYFDFLPSETESAKALRQLEEDQGMSPLFASVVADSVEEARSLSAEIRKLPEVAAVQSVSDLLPPLTDSQLDSLRTVVEVEEQPDFDTLANYPATKNELIPVAAAMLQSVEKLSFAMQLRGQSNSKAVEAAEALRGLRKAFEELPGDGSETLMGLQRKLAGVAKRAWDTAQQVAKRGSYDPSDLPEILKVRFVSQDEDRVAIYAFPSGNVWNREFAACFTKKLEAIDPMASGFVITTHHHTEMIINGFKRAALIATVVIFLMLLWDFRRVDDAVLALVPVGLGWLWMMGIMSISGWAFNVANIVVLPLVLGIGIDAGVHLVHRARESAGSNDGVAQLDDLLRGTGGAVFLSSITTIAGFAGLMVSDYGAMPSLGIGMIVGVACCLLSCLFILPAILVVLGRAK